MTIATVRNHPDAELPLASTKKAAPPTTLAGLALRTPFWVFSGALAVIFLFPLVWTTVASVSPHPGTGQVDGWGFGNYVTLARYQAGIGRYLLNSVIVSGLCVLLTLLISTLGGY